MGTRAVRLSTREGEVALLVAEGLTNREIAKRLFISERTAESHLERIRGKLGFHHRSEIAAWVARGGDTHSLVGTAQPQFQHAETDSQEQLADGRQRTVDERERRADAREALADEREAALDRRERYLRQRDN